jgi:hypothetical protein
MAKEADGDVCNIGDLKPERSIEGVAANQHALTEVRAPCWEDKLHLHQVC